MCDLRILLFSRHKDRELIKQLNSRTHKRIRVDAHEEDFGASTQRSSSGTVEKLKTG